MCFGSGGNPGASAANDQTALLEKQQAKHDSDVAAGKKSIDDSFAQFDDPYFSKYEQTFKDAYNPALDDQYGIAKDKLFAKLAGTDQLGGSVGNDATSRLTKTYNDTQADIGNKAVDAGNAFRTSVDNSKSQLYSQNASAADPLSMATQAQSTAGTIVAPQSYPTLSNVFGDVLGGVSSASKANAGSMNPSPYLSLGYTPASGSGSAVYGS